MSFFICEFHVCARVCVCVLVCVCMCACVCVLFRLNVSNLCNFKCSFYKVVVCASVRAYHGM